jgi:hypothetical protein
MARIEQPLVFVAPTGKSFVYLTDMPFSDGQVCYSPDGKTFYALATGGFGGTTIEHNLSFSDPHRGVDGRLHKADKVITYDDEQYVLREDVEFDPSKVVPLPATRRTEYICMAPDDTFVYVSADKFNYSYESFKLFVGDGKTMRQIPVDDVTRYRDGGTTYIETPEQSFFSPSPFNAERDSKLVPQWGKQKLVNLDASDYDITETADGQVTITKK